MFERTKIKYEKEAGDGPFLKKQWSSQRTHRGKVRGTDGLNFTKIGFDKRRRYFVVYMW